MNLPYPFHKASDVKANLDGTIRLIDAQGKPLARLPLATAFELSPEAEGHGYGFGYGDGSGFGDGSGYPVLVAVTAPVIVTVIVTVTAPGKANEPPIPL